jgi:hypothetical protein
LDDSFYASVPVGESRDELLMFDSSGTLSTLNSPTSLGAGTHTLIYTTARNITQTATALNATIENPVPVVLLGNP